RTPDGDRPPKLDAYRAQCVPVPPPPRSWMLRPRSHRVSRAAHPGPAAHLHRGRDRETAARRAGAGAELDVAAVRPRDAPGRGAALHDRTPPRRVGPPRPLRLRPGRAHALDPRVEVPQVARHRPLDGRRTRAGGVLACPPRLVARPRCAAARDLATHRRARVLGRWPRPSPASPVPAPWRPYRGEPPASGS